MTIEITPSSWYNDKLLPTLWIHDHKLNTTPQRNNKPTSIPRISLCSHPPLLRVESSTTFPIEIVFCRSVWAPANGTGRQSTKHMSSSTHHTKINISTTILWDQSIVIPSFPNITHNKNGAPHTTSPKLASIASHHKKIIFFNWRVIHITFYTVSPWIKREMVISSPSILTNKHDFTSIKLNLWKHVHHAPQQHITIHNNALKHSHLFHELDSCPTPCFIACYVILPFLNIMRSLSWLIFSNQGS